MGNNFETAEKLNFIVRISTLPEKVKGMYFYFQRNKVITLNEKLEENEQESILGKLLRFGTENSKFKEGVHFEY